MNVAKHIGTNAATWRQKLAADLFELKQLLEILVIKTSKK
jgi:hypothetical protein